jgi:hypothetical protein
MLERIRGGLEEKTEPARAAKRILQSARYVKHDKKLRDWYSRNIEGQPPYQVGDIVRRGISLGEITQEEADNLQMLTGFVANEGNPEGRKEET